MTDVRIERFRSNDQAAVRDLVLEGLLEHWGELDPVLNPDLDDLARAYGHGVVLVARLDDRIVGTGVLVPGPDDAAGELVRMSVAREVRRRGVGRALVEAFARVAREQGRKRLVLETTAAWEEAVSFYLGCGFTITHCEDGQFGRDVYFAREL